MTAAAFAQEEWRFRADNGSETTALWTSDLSWDMAARTWDDFGFGTNIRWRSTVRETAGGMATNQQFKAQYNRNSGGWNDITTTSNVIRATGSANFTNGDDTTQQIGGGTFITDNDGMSDTGVWGDGSVTIDMQSNECELELCFQIREADCQWGDVIELRIVENAGTALGAYPSPLPKVRVPIINSLGHGTSHDTTSVTISSASGTGPYTVTVGSTTGAVEGDALWDANGTPRKYLIRSVDSGTQLTVLDTEGVGSAPTTGSTAAYKRYTNGTTPIASWNTNLSKTSMYGTSAGKHALGRMYDDADFTETGTFTINPTSTGLHAWVLTSASSDRHTGVSATGVEIAKTDDHGYIFTMSGSGIHGCISWIEIDGSGTTNYSFGINCDDGGTSEEKTVCTNILHGFHNDGSGAPVPLVGAANNRYYRFLNNMIYDAQATGSVVSVGMRGIISGASSFNIYLIGNSVRDIKATHASYTGYVYGIDYNDDPQMTAINNVVFGTTTAGSGTANDFDVSTAQSTIRNNQSEDSTATGTGSQTTISDPFTSSTDLTLSGSGVSPVDNGLTQTAALDWPWGSHIDIKGRNRFANADTYDVGCHEFVAAPATGVAFLTLLGVG